MFRKILRSIIHLLLLPITRLVFSGYKHNEKEWCENRKLLSSVGYEISVYGINGMFFPTYNEKLVILFQGNNGLYEFSIDKLRMFRGRGYSVLMFNYPGYGKSRGVPNKFTFKKWARKVLGFATQNITQEENIIVYSVSMGSGPAAYISNLYPKAKYIFDRPFSSLSNVVCSKIPWYLSWTKGFVNYIIKSYYWGDNVKKLQDTKADVTFIFPQDDEMIPKSCFEQLSKCVKGATILHVPGGHGYKVDDWRYTECCDAILDQILPTVR